MAHETAAAAPPPPPSTPAGAGAQPPPLSLEPGFRFHPTDEELVMYYLRRKICGKPFYSQAVSETDVYKTEPWQLGQHSSSKTRDLEWIFHKKGLGPPTGDHYAPFLDEEWDDNNNNNHEPQNGELTPIPIPHHQEIPFIISNREKNKSPMQDDSTLLEFPILQSVETKSYQSSQAGEGSSRTGGGAFDSSNLEKSVPPGFLKFLSNLEQQNLDGIMEREAWRMEAFRAQALVNNFESRIDALNRENEDLRRRVRGG
ncbi:OLC1v1020429C1 [Oldenlandia corymbosa var. corymbosa]|uniref:OLC1v1020429C1 n=1 Tax=Oldenlandia corymbosa var. corymbosa TaxID=529605 RepID=A0AAV1EGI6_OLDCO|nr:OLC1v1020429C1 [Oldenlandia corymbosa var. corymbosa]